MKYLSAKSVIPVQITYRNSGLGLANKQEGFCQNQSNLLFSNQAQALDGAIYGAIFPLLCDTRTFLLLIHLEFFHVYH